MGCVKKAYKLQTRRVVRSPFRTMERARRTLKAHRKGESVGFTARSSLKAMGIIPRASGCYELGPKYK
jgi:hypothetical protein